MLEQPIKQSPMAQVLLQHKNKHRRQLQRRRKRNHHAAAVRTSQGEIVLLYANRFVNYNDESLETNRCRHPVRRSRAVAGRRLERPHAHGDRLHRLPDS